MADWRTAAQNRTSTDIINVKLNNNGGIDEYRGCMAFDERWWQGQAQVITENANELVDFEDVDAYLPPALNNDDWY